MGKKKKSIVEENRLTTLIPSLFSLLATANNCASWLNLNVDTAVVRFAIVLTGLGFVVPKPKSEP